MRFDGTKLKEIRAAKGMSQSDLAKKLRVSRVAVTNWERNENEPSLNTIGRLGKEFGINGRYFITDEP